MSKIELVSWVSGIITIIWFGLYLREIWKRKMQIQFMLGFLHALKSQIQSATQRNSIDGSEFKPMIVQIDDALARLQPPATSSEFTTTHKLLTLIFISACIFIFIA